MVQKKVKRVYRRSKQVSQRKVSKRTRRSSKRTRRSSKRTRGSSKRTRRRMKGGEMSVGNYRALEKLLIREGEDTRSKKIDDLEIGVTVHIEEIGKKEVYTLASYRAIRGKIKGSGWVSMELKDYLGKNKNKQLLEFIPQKEKNKDLDE